MIIVPPVPPGQPIPSLPPMPPYQPMPTLGPYLGAPVPWLSAGLGAWYLVIMMAIDERWRDRVINSSPWLMVAPPERDPRLDDILWEARMNFRRKEPLKKRDPLVIDFDGNAIKTTNIIGDSVTLFDHNADKFAEMTGWVAPGDGLLAMDRNGNGIIDDGKELFGDQTILKNGRRASNGFQALADLDTNGDGKIDASDAAYSQLRVLRLNAAGDAYEFRTLDELGIKSIDLDSTVTNTTDAQGNTENRVGNFEMVDGTIRQIAEYGFQRDAMYTIAIEQLAVPEDIAAMPELWGYGTVYGLHQAMVRDTSGQLKSLVEQFMNATDPNSRNALMQQILFKWSGTEKISPTGGFSNYDARIIAMLEKFFGEPFGGGPSVSGSPSYSMHTTQSASAGGSSSNASGSTTYYMAPPALTHESVVALNEAYRLVFEFMYGTLTAQTHLKDLYNEIILTWDYEKQEFKVDMNGVIADLQTNITNNPEQGKQLLSE